MGYTGWQRHGVRETEAHLRPWMEGTRACNRCCDAPGRESCAPSRKACPQRALRIRHLGVTVPSLRHPATATFYLCWVHHCPPRAKPRRLCWVNAACGGGWMLYVQSSLEMPVQHTLQPVLGLQRENRARAPGPYLALDRRCGDFLALSCP